MKDFLRRLKYALASNKKKLIKYGLILLGVVLLTGLVELGIEEYTEERIEKISYNDFLKLVKQKKVDTVYYSTSEEYMTITLYNEDTKGKSEEDLADYVYPNKDKRRVLYPAYDTFRKDLLESDVKLALYKRNYSAKDVLSGAVTIIVPCIWIWLIYGLMKQQTHSLSKDTLIQKSDTKFEDVIGQDEIMQDVRFIVDLLKNRDLGSEIGAKVPKGILLAGEPGTGKTLIAKAIAGEAGVPFLYVNSSSLIEMFVGVGAKRVREVFKLARANSPCIIFFDEIDSIGISRDTRGSNTENEQTINALLQEMDGFTGREGVFIIAATNRPDKLDTALTRAGRLDRRININKPRDWRVRAKLFDFYLNKFKVSEDVDTVTLAKQLSGFTGADIASICNEASIIAVMRGKYFVDMACLEEAVDKKVFHGNRLKDKTFERDRSIVAWHESGHAVAHYLLGEPISRVTIVGTSSGVGGVVFGQDSDTMFRTKEYYENRIKICYAGRVSEQIKFNTVTQGASSDISQATELMREYVTKLGFNEEFGLLDIDVLTQSNIVDQTAFLDILQEMSKKLYDETFKLLKDNFELVDLLAKELLKCETMTGLEVERLLVRGM